MLYTHIIYVVRMKNVKPMLLEVKKSQRGGGGQGKGKIALNLFEKSWRFHNSYLCSLLSRVGHIVKHLAKFLSGPMIKQCMYDS